MTLSELSELIYFFSHIYTSLSSLAFYTIIKLNIVASGILCMILLQYWFNLDIWLSRDEMLTWKHLQFNNLFVRYEWFTHSDLWPACLLSSLFCEKGMGNVMSGSTVSPKGFQDCCTFNTVNEYTILQRFSQACTFKWLISIDFVELMLVFY